MKANFLIRVFLMSVASLMLYSCEKLSSIDQNEDILLSGQEVAVLEVKSDGISTFNLSGVTPPFDTTADLTADEIEFIFAVREDEKLARDIYKAFFDKYKLKAFENISKAETNHIRAVELLFSYYEIDFPPVGNYGSFEDSVRQAKYGELIRLGSTAMEAFKVMAYIEEENIVSYSEVLADISNPNIILVIENLAKASENHLKAAVRQITSLGGTYQAQIMSEEKYREIIAKGFEQGKRYRYLNNGQMTNRMNRIGEGSQRGSVNRNGECTGTQNGNTQGSNNGKGTQGRGYRGGR